jgi:hypothetical protein
MVLKICSVAATAVSSGNRNKNEWLCVIGTIQNAGDHTQKKVITRSDS